MLTDEIGERLEVDVVKRALKPDGPTDVDDNVLVHEAILDMCGPRTPNPTKPKRPTTAVPNPGTPKNMTSI
ncbi:hypothetical protein GCM10009869_06580 [Amnibacterium kyonggiense]